MSSPSSSSKQPPIRLRPVPRERTSPDAAAAFGLGALPRPLTSLIGREADVATALALLLDEGVRLLTLTGPGGVGKTRLAARVAEEAAPAFADGVVFVPLADIADPDLVLPTIARTLELRETSAQSPCDLLAGYLRDRQLLLVLDNVEQVRPAAAQLAALLAACPRLVILVTSRAILRVAGEQRFPVAPLALPETKADGRAAPRGKRRKAEGSELRREIEESAAVQLCVARAQAVEPRFMLDAENAVTIAAICRRLDGLPLAIELAAARLRHFSPHDVIARLDPALPLLIGGPEDAPDRLRTMRQTIAWSYDLLSPAEQTLFRRLSVFVGGFTLEAAEDVGGGGEPCVMDLVSSLADKSLLQRGQSDGWESRFSMLETVREFALERLEESGEAAAIAAAHAASIVRLAERSEPVLFGPAERRWDARWDAELGNLRAALTWTLAHDNDAALRIGAALWRYWAWHHATEGRRWLTAALAAPTPETGLVRARALTTSGALATLEGDVASGLAAAKAAVPLAREAGDQVAEGLARWVVACAHFLAGRVETAASEVDGALPLLDLATTSTDRVWAAYARSLRGATALMMGEPAQGLVFYEEALARARDAETVGITLVILSDFAGWLIDRGETARARGMLEEELSLAAAHRETYLMVTTLISLALADAVEGAAAAAARRLGAIDALLFLAGLALPVHYEPRIDRATALAKAALGEESFTAAWTVGHADPAAIVAESSGLLRAGEPAPEREADGNRVAFSPREREVLRLLVSGLSDKEIGAALGLGRRSAASHVAAIRAKLDAPSRTAAAAIAVRDHLL